MEEKMKSEACKRMEAMEISGDIIQKFSRNNEIYCSFKGENIRLVEPVQQLVDTFAKEYGHTPYYTILNFTDIGNFLTIFFVSTEESLWSGDWLEQEHNYQYVYVSNLDVYEFSEFGTVGFQRYNGCLLRKW